MVNAHGDLLITSFVDLLDFTRDVVEHVEQESAEMLWSQEDYVHITEIFERFVPPGGRLPTAQLFSVVDQLGFDELDMSQIDQQRWLANIIRNTLSMKRASVTRCSLGGTLSLEDFVRIVTTALRKKER